MSSNQIDEVRAEKTNGHMNGKAASSPTKNGKLTSLEIKKKKKIEKRRKKVEHLLTAATSIKEENIYMEAFERLEMVDTGNIDSSNIDKIRYLVRSNGLQKDDPRIATVMEQLNEFDNQRLDLDFDRFKEAFQPCFTMVKKLLENQFTYTDYPEMFERAKKIFDEVKEMPNEGVIPDYIPALLDTNEEAFGVSICTVDGQFINLGDFDEKTCMHAISGAISYLIAQQQLGEETLRQYIGAEPSGNQFNALELMRTGIPHNPLNCAGSLMSSALIYKGESNAKKYESYSNVVKKMIGGRKVNFYNEMYLSEVENAHANFSLLYMMEEHDTLPPGTDIKKTLQFYTQC